jgi:hypothetical protein
MKDLKKGDIALLYDPEWKDGKWKPEGELRHGLFVKSDAFKAPEVDGKFIWAVSCSKHCPPEEARKWKDVDKICFSGDGKGGYLGCAGTKRPL